MHYSGIRFESVCICMHKVMRNGSDTCCGNSPTAQDPTDMLHKCAEHHSGTPMPRGLFPSEEGAVDLAGSNESTTYPQPRMVTEKQMEEYMNRQPHPFDWLRPGPTELRDEAKSISSFDVKQDYERELKMYTDAMRYKLSLNASRGKWEKMTLVEALAKCKGEIAELEEAINRGSAVEILLEAADVGNYALIAAHIAMQEALNVRA